MNKVDNLQQKILTIGKDGLCIAFSGGVDSTLLLKLAVDLLGDKVSAVTFSSRLNPKAEIHHAKGLAESMGAKHYILQFDELSDERIINNPVDRCYYCKRFIFSTLKDFCREHNLGAIADGTNADDLHEYRPGLKALRELSINSPLAESDFTKAEVRALAAELKLQVYNKPSSPCLATRVPYGVQLTDKLLNKVEAAEECLKELGFISCRVRAHEDVARIEVPVIELDKLIGLRSEIIAGLKKAGFIYITLDIEGLRSGSMDIPFEINNSKEDMSR